jgi:putative membrane protein
VSLGELLPPWNAALNLVSGVLVVLGVRAIRAGERERHRRLMLLAVAVSTLFLLSYLTRVALTGTHRFPGSGPLKVTYLAILISHTALAAVVAPMVVTAVYLGLSSRLAAHRRLARLTFPIWLYVSATGVVVYLLLYEVAPRLSL